MNINPRELATVLAALRHWQHLEETSPAIPFKPGDDRTGTHFEDHDPLTAVEIDALCERLNVSEVERQGAEVDAMCVLEDFVNRFPDGEEGIEMAGSMMLDAQLQAARVVLGEQEPGTVKPPRSPRIIICLEGGLVTTVKSDILLDVTICDFDGLEDGEEERKRLEQLEAEAIALPVEAY